VCGSRHGGFQKVVAETKGMARGEVCALPRKMECSREKPFYPSGLMEVGRISKPRRELNMKIETTLPSIAGLAILVAGMLSASAQEICHPDPDAFDDAICGYFTCNLNSAAHRALRPGTARSLAEEAESICHREKLAVFDVQVIMGASKKDALDFGTVMRNEAIRNNVFTIEKMRSR